MSGEWIDRETDFLHASANSGKIKFIEFRVGMVKNDHGLLVHKTLKSAVT